MTNEFGNESKTADEVHQAEPLAAWTLPSMDGLEKILWVCLVIVVKSTMVILEIERLVICVWNSA